MCIRDSLNTMARGHSGVRVDVAEFVAVMLNADLVPWVPSRGSRGASGDLAPSAHLVLAMMGEGELLGLEGGREPAGPALRAAGLAPLTSKPKKASASSTAPSSWPPSAVSRWPTARRCLTPPTSSAP